MSCIPICSDASAVVSFFSIVLYYQPVTSERRDHFKSSGENNRDFNKTQNKYFKEGQT